MAENLPTSCFGLYKKLQMVRIVMVGPIRQVSKAKVIKVYYRRPYYHALFTASFGKDSNLGVIYDKYVFGIFLTIHDELRCQICSYNGSRSSEETERFRFHKKDLQRSRSHDLMGLDSFENILKSRKKQRLIFDHIALLGLINQINILGCDYQTKRGGFQTKKG